MPGAVVTSLGRPQAETHVCRSSVHGHSEALAERCETLSREHFPVRGSWLPGPTSSLRAVSASAELLSESPGLRHLPQCLCPGNPALHTCAALMTVPLPGTASCSHRAVTPVGRRGKAATQPVCPQQPGPASSVLGAHWTWSRLSRAGIPELWARAPPAG